MKENIESVLAAVQRLDYQSSISVQKLIYLNSLARSLVLRSFRELPREEETLSLLDNVGVLNRFATNGENLTRLGHLPEEEKRAGFGAIRENLKDLLLFLSQAKKKYTEEEQAYSYPTLDG